MVGCPPSGLLQLAMSIGTPKMLMLLCLEWVNKAWNMVTCDVIVHSFKAFKISSSTDGSDDVFIHCLNPGGVALSAVGAIATDCLPQ